MGNLKLGSVVCLASFPTKYLGSSLIVSEFGNLTMILTVFSLLLLFTGTFCVFLGYGLFYFISRKVSSMYFIIFCPSVEFSVLVVITCLRLAIFLFLSIYYLSPPCCFEATGIFLFMPT